MLAEQPRIQHNKQVRARWRGLGFQLTDFWSFGAQGSGRQSDSDTRSEGYLSDRTKLTTEVSPLPTVTFLSQVLGSEKIGRCTLCSVRTSKAPSSRKSFQPSCQA